MKDKIIELAKQGKGVMDIAKIVGCSHSYVSRILSDGLSDGAKVSDGLSDGNTGCLFGRDKTICDQFKEVNRLGVHKLRACDYTKEELLKFKDAPYWDCS